MAKKFASVLDKLRDIGKLIDIKHMNPLCSNPIVAAFAYRPFTT